MSPLKLDALLKTITVTSLHGHATIPINGIALDSRQVAEGFLFIATHGSQQDGTSYVDDAIRRGATAILSSREAVRGLRVPQVQVPDTREAAARLAAAFHHHPARTLRTVGITGTNGKTTTSYLVRDVLDAAGLNPGLLGTVQYKIGERGVPASRTTPDAVQIQSWLAQMRQAGCRSAALEVSSHALDQKRTFSIGFDVAVFTNMTRDHLDYHGDMERYFEAKRRLFSESAENKPDAAAVINVDDAWGRRLADMPLIQSRLLCVGIDTAADVSAHEVQQGPDGARFILRSPWGSEPVHTALIGRHNVYNLLCAAAATGALGLPLRTIVQTLSSSTGAPGRLERVETGRGFHAFVDYAHSDAALENVLQALRPLARNKLIVVFGCGGNRDTGKRPAMGRIATHLADITIVTSDNPRREDPEAIIRDIQAGIDPAAAYRCITDRPTAVAEAVKLARDGDIVLVAGKGHEQYQELANTTVSMDDRELIRKAL